VLGDLVQVGLGVSQHSDRAYARSGCLVATRS
jgi:hypothetical protein